MNSFLACAHLQAGLMADEVNLQRGGGGGGGAASNLKCQSSLQRLLTAQYLEQFRASEHAALTRIAA